MFFTFNQIYNYLFIIYKNNFIFQVMNLLGIHPDFWAVVNEKNPLIEKDYCELSYFVKVWLVKSLCDYVTVSC